MVSRSSKAIAGQRKTETPQDDTRECGAMGSGENARPTETRFGPRSYLLCDDEEQTECDESEPGREKGAIDVAARGRGDGRERSDGEWKDAPEGGHRQGDHESRSEEDEKLPSKRGVTAVRLDDRRGSSDLGVSSREQQHEQRSENRESSEREAEPHETLR